tara:strand:+ start:468 stop:1346 length:879 start_codon:yes stop_codon:yes gene_type:complete
VYLNPILYTYFSLVFSYTVSFKSHKNKAKKEIEVIHRITVSDELLAYLNEHRVYFTPFGNCKVQGRFRPTDQLVFPSNGRIEPYSNYINGSFLFSMGSFSFTRSVFPINTVIGRYCSIGARVSVMGIDHPISRFTTANITYDRQAITNAQFFKDHPEIENFQVNNQEPKNTLSATIGNDVWIGEDVTIARGVSIGDGAILASKALVTKDVPPYAIVGGVPAKIIRFRFPQNAIDRLVQLKWWNYEVQSILSASADIPIEEFVEMVENAVERGNAKQYNPKVVDESILAPYIK